MAVRVIVPDVLRPLAAGRQVLVLDPPPPTVGDALRAIRRQWPGVYDRVITETAEVRPHVNLFVGEEDVRRCGGLDAQVPDGGEVYILPAVSGG
jgi:molybdopterin converting factor small subunit